MKIVPNRILSFLAALIPCAVAYAGPGDGPPPPGVPPGPGLPIDGGVLVLAAFAILFGLMKIYQLNKNKKTPI